MLHASTLPAIFLGIALDKIIDTLVHTGAFGAEPFLVDKTRRFAEGERIKEFESFQQQTEKGLEILEAAPSLDSLRQLRSNRLEALSGDRAGE
ncbi:hypothetical protein [Nitrosococcus wardiae]|uniref:Uncharacterized protein n=1 Tax=Nitrosococcus wardiae TaxID=1814290 RepID=A0A4P7C148_9GAMM|nr:hypothetical protein [Nitrosococcus wardiae]QBQ55317.1 hypothetical protein E3U44_12945 [Nitrosococcus wardiae]